jgi:hypothetical protein
MLFPIILLASRTEGSTLSDAASSLGVGEWVQIQTTNDESVLETDAGQYDIFDNYSSQMTYDPTSDSIYYMGCSHHGDFDCKFVKYNIATNTWSTLTDHGDSIVHGYDHNALDSRRSVFYSRIPSYKTIKKYTISSSSWSSLPASPVSYGNIADAFGYFSSADKLVYINSNNNEISYYDLPSSSWDSLQTTGISMGGYHAQGADLPKHGLFIFGGGNYTNNLWSINRDKTITSIGNPTGSLNINVNSDSDNGCYFLQDPVSGDLLLFHDNGIVYSWNPTDGWGTVSGVSSKMGVDAVDGHAGVSLPKYGVVMSVRRNNGDVEVWLYKHKLSTAPPITNVPNAPTGLRRITN